MLIVNISESEVYDEINNRFINVKEQRLQLEHSLVSISKWESKWHKSFINTTDKTYEEIIDYIRCMTITQNVKPEVYSCLTAENINQIQEYINDPMTATVFLNDKETNKSREVVTSELIYYWMISFNIPTEYSKWHLNRLITLIRVCMLKNTPPKKMSKRELASRNAAINEARRKRLNSRG